MSAPLLTPRAAAAESWIRWQRVVTILRVDNAEHIIGICEDLVASGLTVIEVTADRPHAIASIAQIRSALGDDVLLGAGTVLDAGTAARVAAAGADFCVAPNLDPDVVSSCAELEMLAIPGVFSPTEVAAARKLGLRLLKLFPCGGLSPAFLTALRGPFGDIGFIPTGGVDLTNAADWIAAGAAAVGIGSAIVGRDGASTNVAERARQLRASVAGVRPTAAGPSGSHGQPRSPAKTGGM